VKGKLLYYKEFTRRPKGRTIQQEQELLDKQQQQIEQRAAKARSEADQERNGGEMRQTHFQPNST
jgi:hypothetical protein